MQTRLLSLLSLLLFLTTCAPAPTVEEGDDSVVEVTLPPMDDVGNKLAELGIELPTLGAPMANYVHAVRTGNLVFLAGKGPTRPDGSRVTGKLGQDLTVEEGYAAARLVGISQLAALQGEIGDLNKVRRVVKVLGMVNSDPGFTDHSKVVNGFSDLMVEVFGERGKHARSAVGMVALPSNIAVEIEVIVEVE